MTLYRVIQDSRQTSNMSVIANSAPTKDVTLRASCDGTTSRFDRRGLGDHCISTLLDKYGGGRRRRFTGEGDYLRLCLLSLPRTRRVLGGGLGRERQASLLIPILVLFFGAIVQGSLCVSVTIVRCTFAVRCQGCLLSLDSMSG